MNAGIVSYLLSCLILSSLVVTQASPFIDPDEGDYNVNVTHSGLTTTINLNENNAENMVIAIVNEYTGTDKPGVMGTDFDQLGLDFELQEDKWVMIIKNVQNYEREEKHLYDFTVILDQQERVNVQIVNVDDEPPYITPVTSTCVILETFKGETDCLFKVTDADNIMSGMKFTVFNSEGAIDNKIGLKESGTSTCGSETKCIGAVLEIETELDFITAPVHSLTLQVKDSAEHTGELSYVVQVQAVNKNVPKITPAKLEATIKEDFSGFVPFAANITVQDKDSGLMGQFDITLDNIKNSECVGAFAVVPGVGYLEQPIELSVNYPNLLDYEKGCRDLVFNIIATERANNSHFGSTEVKITVENVNDNAPQFEQETYHFSVIENENINTFINSVIATDKDGDKITYSLTSGTSYLEYKQNGELYTNVVFDYERQPEIIVSATAFDGNFTGYAQITLSIIDVNDERPELRLPSSQLYWNETTEKDTHILTVTASDKDTHPELEITIDWERSSATKSGVQQTSGVFNESVVLCEPEDENEEEAKDICVNGGFDWGKFDTLNLVIKVEDKNTSALNESNRFSSATVTINILDENNHEPVLPEISNLDVYENNTNIGMLLRTIVATDEDGPNNNNIIYNLICDEHPGKDYLKIVTTPTSGEIHTGNDRLNYEEFQNFTCTVYASDGMHESNKSMTINVIDINDEDPYITGSYDGPYTFFEGQEENVSFVTIKARDNDISAKYNTPYFECLNCDIFRINGTTGEFYLPEGNGKATDYDDGPKSYRVQIIANDHCPQDMSYICQEDNRKSNPVAITINVKDYNDNTPEFSDAVTTSSVPEDAEIKSTVLIVEATDKDESPNNDLTFSLTKTTCVEDCRTTRCQKNYLSLFDAVDRGDNKSASVIVTDDLTDCWGTYELTIQVSDYGEPRLSTSGTFRVTVTDTNNHEPEFSYPTEGQVIKLKLEGNVVNAALYDYDNFPVTVRATDIYDKGENGTEGITLELTGDDTALKHFSLPSGSLSNEITLQLIEDFSKAQDFQLHITAYDGNESNRRSKDVTAKVQVRSTTAHAPVFEFKDVWNTTFMENTTGLYVTIDVDAIDPDDTDEQHDPIYYFLIQGNKDLFVLEPETKLLTVKDVLDREEEEFHILTVGATNNKDGSGVNSTLTVKVIVDDMKDTAPEFPMPIFAKGINVGEDTIDDRVTTINATDRDKDDKLTYKVIGEFKYSDESLNSVNKPPFELNPETGDLILKFDVKDSILKGYIKFEVQATDLGNNTSNAIVQIYMITEDNILIFKFNNNKTYVDTHLKEIEDILTGILEKQSSIKNAITGKNTAGIRDIEWTDVLTYFVDNSRNEPVSKDNISRVINVQGTYNKLRSELMKLELLLEEVGTPSSESTSNFEQILKTVLIVISGVLAILVIVLFAAFFIKTRRLNRRLEALSTTKFGSQDSGLNRIGMKVPNTNKYAVEGSNPVWGNEKVGSRDFDIHSISSGDSDLIGIEDNPEFNEVMKNGIANGSFTPDSFKSQRRPTGHPHFVRNPSFDPLSPALENDLMEEDPRRESVNPLASAKYMNFHNGDVSNDQNRNFTILKRTDSTFTTEL